MTKSKFHPFWHLAFTLHYVSKILICIVIVIRAYESDKPPVRNITVAVSFGAERELSLEKMDSPKLIEAGAEGKDGNKNSGNDTSDIRELAARISVPQSNNGVFSIGRDVNIRFRNGIVEATNKPRRRLEIILWGEAEDVKEEEGSPALLKRSPPAGDLAEDTG